MSQNEQTYLLALKKATQKIKELMADVERLKTQPKIAIVGLGCRFPGGANNPAQFWKLLAEGRDAVTEIPATRWDWRSLYDPNPSTPGKSYAHHGAFLDDVRGFDPAFFGMNPLEAQAMDPQQRLLLEVAWESLEDAGLNPQQLRGSNAGIFLGMDSFDYVSAHLGSDDATRIDEYAATGVAFSTAAGRLSYFFDFKGPSLTVDTACSSSLVAIQLAIRALRGGEADFALAGGVDLILTPESYIGFSKLQALAPDGRCRSFDASASGFVKGEGCGLFVLKRLEDALRDGDRIRGILRGGAINQDGESSGLTAPNALAQRDLIRKALADAGLDPEALDYLECHGTGTPLGDPIEARALDMVFGARSKKLLIGSVKSNIGHLQAASGSASLMKLILALEAERLPASLHFETPNPHIPWSDSILEVVAATRSWPRGERPRIAGVSAFGFSGTNAHLILEEAPTVQPQVIAPLLQTAGVNLPHLLVFSAHSESALRNLATAHAEALSKLPVSELPAYLHACRLQRANFSERVALVAKSGGELSEKLRQFAQGQQPDGCYQGNGLGADLAFLFTGQGSLYPQMGAELYHAFPRFRQVIDRCAAAIESFDLRSYLLEPTAAKTLEQTAHAQPLLFALEIALFELWRAFGIQPRALLGHSIGEWVAACAAGILDLESGIRMAALRGSLMQTLPANGGMLVAECAAETLAPLLQAIDPSGQRLVIAGYNAPNQCAISGANSALDQLRDCLNQRAIPHRGLHVSHAFHAPAMAPMIEDFRKALQQESFEPAKIPLLSTLNGNFAEADEMSRPEYWCQQILQPVSFAQAAVALANAGIETTLELGPHPVLTGLVRQCDPTPAKTGICSLVRGESSCASLLTAVAQLYCAGYSLDWTLLAPNPGFIQRVPLPLYPFQRQTLWLEPVRNHFRNQTSEAPPLESRLAPQLNRPSVQIDQESVPMTNTNSASQDQRHAKIAAELQEIIQQISGIAGARLNDNLFRIGLGSIMLTRMKQRIEGDYGVDIPMSWFYERADSIAKLANQILALLPPAEQRQLDDRSTSLPSQSRAEQLAPEQPTPSLASTADPNLQEIVQQQLRLMSQQLEMLRGVQAQPPTSHMPQAAKLEQHTQVKTPASSQQALNQRNEMSRHDKVDFRSMKLSPDELTPRQRAFIQDFSARHNRRTAKSKALMSEYRPVFSDWINSLGFRQSIKELIYPIVSNRSKGSKLWDVDGNEYLDMAIGYGVHYFGNKPAFVAEALKKQVDEGYQLGPQFELSGEVARQISRLTGCERVTFTNTGTEAVMTALRVARTATGRDKIVIFQNSYHGTFDGILARPSEEPDRLACGLPTAPGTPPAMAADVIVLPYGDPASLARIEAEGRNLAAVLVEPIQSRNPSLQPRDFLQQLRAITERNRTALIFDEIITGFRVQPGGAQAFFGVRADIVTYGKILGGGMPIGVVAGSGRFLDTIDGGLWSYGDDSVPGKGVTFFGGTFCKHPLSIVAAHAVLSEIERQGPALQQRVNQLADQLAKTANAFFQRERVPLRIRHGVSYFRFESHGDYDANLQATATDLLFYLMMHKGVYTWERRICFVSAAHTAEDLAFFQRALEESVAELRSGGFPYLDHSAPDPSSKPESELHCQAEQAQSLLPLSDEQKRLYALAQYEAGELAYHLPEGVLIEGEPDSQRLQRAINQVVARHPALRTSFLFDEGDIGRMIHPSVEVLIEERDGQGQTLEQLCQQFIRPFHLEQPPLLRIALIRLEAKRYLLLFDLHHIAADGISAEIVVREIVSFYQGQQLPALKHDYETYIQAQRDYRKSAAFRKDRDYWHAKLADLPNELQLPTDFPRPARLSFHGDHYFFKFDEAPTLALKKLAAEQAAPLYFVTLSAFYLLLQRLSGSEDLLVGLPVSTRTDARFEPLVGLFLNAIALRAKPASDHTFSQFLAQVKSELAGALDHLHYPFAELVGALNLVRDPSRNPLYDATFSFESADTRAMQLDELVLRPHFFKPKATIIDFSLEVTETEGRLSMRIDYRTDLFQPATIARFANYYTRILEQISNQPEIKLHQVQVLDELERHELLVVRNDTDAAYPEKMLPDLFEAQVAKTPERIAVITAAESVTYAELNRRANLLAWKIRAQIAPEPGQILALYIDRSVELAVAVLAAIKAGAAYLPIDDLLPSERVSFMVRDAGAIGLLTKKALGDRLGLHEIARINLDQDLDFSCVQPDIAAPARVFNLDQLAYIIYTSGSTGRPKGCRISHRNIVRLVVNERFAFDLGPDDVWMMAHSCGFDVSVWEMYGAWFYGSSLVVTPFSEVQDASAFHDLLVRHRVSVLNQTPAAFHNLMREDLGKPARLHEHLRWVMIGGDKLELAHLQDWFKRYPSEQIKLTNMYGTTETTVFICCYRLTEADLVALNNSPIGRPMPGMKLYLLDKHLQPVPTGSIGEIYAGGLGVGPGYLNRPELNAERFIANPFGPGRLYKTGDLGRWLADGGLLYLGRNDFQVQLRGYRIELGEVERQLMEHPAVREVLVIARTFDEVGKELIAYIVKEPNQPEPSIRELREHLGKNLPAYMIPAYFVRIEAFPLTTNLKINRAALPDPHLDQKARPALGTAHESPRGAFEEAVARVWGEVMAHSGPGRNDNFFDLGGDSIKAIQIVARLRRLGYKLDIATMMAHPTIAQLSVQAQAKGIIAINGDPTAQISHSQPSSHASEARAATNHQSPLKLVQFERESPASFPQTQAEELPLTPIQHWFFERVRKLTPHTAETYFSQAALLMPRNKALPIDAHALHQALCDLCQQHEALHFCFDLSTTTPIQRVHKTPQLPRLSHADLRFLRAEPHIAARCALESSEIELAVGPLVRAVLFATDEGERLMLVIHHLVVDAVSWRILLEDLDNAYAARVQNRVPLFPASSSTYRAWAEALRQRATSSELALEVAYWQDLEKAPTASLPYDPEALASAAEAEAFDRRAFALDAASTSRLLALAQGRGGVGMLDLLLLALSQALRLWHGGESTRIWLESHGRGLSLSNQELDPSRTVGWFTSLFPFVLRCPAASEFDPQLQQIHAALKAIPNQGIGYGLLRYLVDPSSHGLSFQSEPELLFNYLGSFEAAPSSQWQIADQFLDEGAAAALRRVGALDLEALILDGVLEVTATYDPARFGESLIWELLDQLQSTLLGFCKQAQNVTASTPETAQLSAKRIPEWAKLLAECEIDGLPNKRLEPEQIEDAFELSPMQQGMLFHAVHHSDSAYFEQFGFELEGPFNASAFEAAWRSLFQRHAILRAVLLHRGLDQPLQVIPRTRDFPFQRKSLLGLDEVQLLVELDRLATDDRARAFDPSKDPLMRVNLVALGPDRHYALWSFHHILIDGWSAGILIRELFESYAALRLGHALPDFPSAPAFRTQITWLRAQDLRASLHYWEQLLEDYIPPITQSSARPEQRGYRLKTMEHAFDETQSAALQALASKNRVTLNALFQAFWGILLAKRAKVDDIVFGAVVSGRPPELEGVERMVGLFLNTIPVRVRLERDLEITTLFQRIQSQAWEGQAHHHTPLAEIQKSVAQEEGLFETVLVFENYPLLQGMREWVEAQVPELKLGPVQEFEQTNYPLVLEVYPEKSLLVEFNYDANRIEKEEVQDLLTSLKELVTQVTNTPTSTIGSFMRPAQLEQSINPMAVLSEDF